MSFEAVFGRGRNAGQMDRKRSNPLLTPDWPRIGPDDALTHHRVSVPRWLLPDGSALGVRAENVTARLYWLTNQEPGAVEYVLRVSAPSEAAKAMGREAIYLWTWEDQHEALLADGVSAHWLELMSMGGVAGHYRMPWQLRAQP